MAPTLVVLLSFSLVHLKSGDGEKRGEESPRCNPQEGENIWMWETCPSYQVSRRVHKDGAKVMEACWNVWQTWKQGANGGESKRGDHKQQLCGIVKSSLWEPFFRARWIRGWRSRQETAFSAPGTLLMVLTVTPSSTLSFHSLQADQTMIQISLFMLISLVEARKTVVVVNMANVLSYIITHAYTFLFPAMNPPRSQSRSQNLAWERDYYRPRRLWFFAYGRGQLSNVPENTWDNSSCLRWQRKRRYCRSVTSSWDVVHVWVCNYPVD